ncbi:MAG: 3-oxoacyl-ACP reductase [Thermodesulfobacterium geofontis]|uniref:3-oxoacyl-[acyl-carrier-protein] reductase n=1 Tax=Thermodesulfobacterium geofontis TaxID=1295609 RepID=A0A2N7PQ30_9BACT|nr:MAG: 3-oxoacyl-ACP reductase [Thermodesulfobacterium geofontis]PMP94384.1 MAG: 3-oxoacyl-ACP reductase [Thermodesulfobacterium geofontis]
MGELSEKIALITGASRGIGSSIAYEFAKQGATVIINYKSSEDMAKVLAEKIEKIGGKAYLSKFDVSNPEEVKEKIKEIEKEIGNIHILVNNAGIVRDTLFLRMKEEDWDRVIKTNLYSVFYVTQAVLPMMLKEKWGRIINISSVVAFTGNPGQTNYAAAKAGIIGFSKALALEVAGKNITVNVIAPGYIETDMTAGLPEKIKEAFLQQIPLKRAGLPEEVAYLAAFLASEKASYITGCVFHINGGLYRG